MRFASTGKAISPDRCHFILGNPPFGGKQFGDAEQKADMDIVCGNVKGGGVLDYVTAWYFKAGGIHSKHYH